MSERITPEMIATEHPVNPTEMWRWLTHRDRTSAARIHFNEAIKTFLTRVKMTISDDGVRYLGRRFDSAALRNTGLLDKAASGQTVKVVGYVLHMCVRFAWISVHGQLIEIEAVLPLRDDVSQRYLSQSELQCLQRRTAKPPPRIA